MAAASAACPGGLTVPCRLPQINPGLYFHDVTTQMAKVYVGYLGGI